MQSMRMAVVAALTIVISGLTLLAAGGAAKADPVVPGAEHCVINVRSDDRLNIRSQPGSQAPIVGQKAYADCGILVTTCSAGWCAVEDGQSKGWANGKFLAMVSPSLYCVANVPPGDMLNLRAFPSNKSQVLTRLGRTQCDIAFLPYAVGSWQKIRVGGWQGWVNRRFVSGQ